MATPTHSTRAPARLPFTFRPSAPVQDHRTADDLLAEIDRQAAPAPRGGLRGAIAGAWRGIEADAARTREALQAASA